MKKINKLPQKKTVSIYFFKETLSLCNATSDTDTTSPTTLTTTHVFKK